MAWGVKSVVADASCAAAPIAKHCFDHSLVPMLLYKRLMTRKEYFKKHEYAWEWISWRLYLPTRLCAQILIDPSEPIETDIDFMPRIQTTAANVRTATAALKAVMQPRWLPATFGPSIWRKLIICGTLPATRPCMLYDLRPLSGCLPITKKNTGCAIPSTGGWEKSRMKLGWLLPAWTWRRWPTGAGDKPPRAVILIFTDNEPNFAFTSTYWKKEDDLELFFKVVFVFSLREAERLLFFYVMKF